MTISISAIVSAAIASTTTTALGTMTGSWRPVMEMLVFSPSAVTVSCSLAIDGVGFTAARTRMACPSLIPPSIPPEWFVFLWMQPSLE